MDRISQNRCAVLFCTLLIVCWSREQIDVKTRPATDDEIPGIQPTILHDECGNVEVIRNHHQSDFILVLTKCLNATGPEKGAIYKYDESNTDFSLVELKTPNNTTIDIDQIIPSGDKMFCISKSQNIAFFIDENLKTEHLQPLVLNYTYVPHPDHPNMIIRYPTQSKRVMVDADFTQNYGAHWTVYFLSYRKFDWVHDSEKYIFIDSKNDLHVNTLIPGESAMKVSLVSDYKLYHNHILVMQSNAEKTYNLSIIDLGKNTHNLTHFPSLLKIKDVKFFQHAFGNHYLLLVDENLMTCLWTTIPKAFHFVRKACYSEPLSGSVESNILIDPRFEGLVYMNLPSNNHHFASHRSINDGKIWDVAKIDTKPLKYAQHVRFNFALHDLHSVPEHFDWYDFQYEKLEDGLQPFMTINGGHSWNPTPKSSTRIIMLNLETVIISLSHDLRAIIYSLDKGATWLSHELLPNNSTLHHFGQLSNSDLSVLIVTRNSQTKELRFDILDFSNIFQSDCLMKQFLHVPLPRSRGFCHRGQNINIVTRDPNILCANKYGQFTYVESLCPCSSDDFVCDFNFHLKDGICVLDPLSNITETPFTCEKGVNNDITRFGYIKFAHDSCDSRETQRYYKVSDNVPCALNELNNFLILSSPWKMYVSQIMLSGGYFRKHQPIQVYVNKKANLKQPTTFDYLQQRLYNYLDNYITRFRSRDQNIKVLYYMNDAIIDMVYDPEYHVFIYLTNRQQLKILSLLTNYEHVVSESVTWFTYSQHHRLLSMVMSKNVFCYGEFLETPKCVKSSFDILQSFVDFRNSKVFLLTTANILKIQTFSKDPTSLQPLNEIHEVSQFAVHDDNLYFLVNGELMYGNLKHNYSDVLVKGYKLTGLKLHRGSFENFKYICEGLNCPFFCQLSLTAEVTCGCPSPLELVANKCICPKDHTNCAFPRCAGFKCNNSKCLRNNVRCNGVDDCGDNSDEMNCTKICSSDTHLCGNKCFDRDAVCGPVDIKVIDPMAGSKKMRTFYVLMIIWTVFVLLGYPGYLTLKWLCIKHGPRFLRLNSNISGFDMGYHELLEAENEPPHMMLAD